jgi:sodium/potassium-transporting ATPase subunit alpha
MKGAPDVLINRCTSYVSKTGDEHPLDQDMRATFESIKNTYSSQGKRCLLLARKIIKADGFKALPGTSDYETAMLAEAKTGLTLVGLVAIVDPLRREIRDVVHTLRRAGIKIHMVRRDDEHAVQREY